MITHAIRILAAVGASHGAQPQAAPPLPKPTPEFKVEELAAGLRAPWELVFLPDGRVWFTEREGRVRAFIDGKLQPEPVFTPAGLKSWQKMGLLGLVLAPDFATSRLLYLAENYEEGKANFMRVVRYRESGGTFVEPMTLVQKVPAFWNHTGGRLSFGPDGKLYITTGDADKPPLSQNPRSLAGKILRLNPDGTTPADNPFADGRRGRPEVWTFGHRNPQGLAFQPGTGRLFAPEHGPDGGDEINLIAKGSNYGWPVVSHEKRKDGLTPSLLQYTPSIAPSGAMFYTGDLFPMLKGDLLVGCLRGEGIVRVQLDGDKVVTAERMLHKKLGRLREVVQAPDGSLWVTTSEFDPPDGRNLGGFDKIYRLTPAGIGAPEAIPGPGARPVGAEAIFATYCLGCHGEVDKPGLHSSLFDGVWTLGSKDEDLARVIREGSMERGMPSYADRLTPAEIEGLIQRIRAREKQGGK